MTRTVAQACQPCRLCTGCGPASRPSPSSRTSSPDQHRQRHQADDRAERHQPRRVTARPAPSESGVPQPRRGHGDRGQRASSGSSDDQRRGGRVRDDPASPVPRPVGPRAARAEPAGRAGAPDQNSPAGTSPEHRRARRDLGALADRRRRGRACCARRPVARAPTRTGPRCRTSPSSQWPERSTSGSIEQPGPRVSMPVIGGTLCRSTSLPDLRAQQPWRSRASTVAPERLAAPSSSASRSASHSRRCTFPPRG